MITPDANLLTLLLQVAECGSYNKAAVALRISQPALSVKIAQLERQVGVKLFERGPKGTFLTPYGKMLVHFARSIENIRNRAATELRLKFEGCAGMLTVGATPVALVSLLPAAINLLDAEVGGLSAQIVEGLDENLNAQLLNHELDITVGVVGIDAIIPGIIETPLFTEPLDLIIRSGTPLDSRRSIALSELTDRRWALPEHGTAFQRQVEALLISAEIPIPANTVRCASLLAIRRLVMLGDRLAILPRQAVQQDCLDGLLTAIPICGAGTTRKIGYRLRQGEEPLPLVQRFISLLRKTASDLDENLHCKI